MQSTPESTESWILWWRLGRFAISSWEEVPEQVIHNCWSKCAIVGAVTMADLT